MPKCKLCGTDRDKYDGVARYDTEGCLIDFQCYRCKPEPGEKKVAKAKQKVLDAYKEISKKMGRPPTKKELADEVGITIPGTDYYCRTMDLKTTDARKLPKPKQDAVVVEKAMDDAISTAGKAAECISTTKIPDLSRLILSLKREKVKFKISIEIEHSEI